MEIIYLEDGIKINNEFISLETINTNCKLVSIEKQKFVLLNIGWKETRGFDGCYEQFCLPEKDIIEIISIIKNKKVFFGEIAGKHSDIHGTITDDDISINRNPKAILDFLPNKHDCNHSFIDNLLSEYNDLYSDDITELDGELTYEEAKKLSELTNI